MDLSRQFSLEQYRILLEVCGLDVQERTGAKTRHKTSGFTGGI